MADTPLGGIDWDSYKRQGPETDPRAITVYAPTQNSGRQWRDHLAESNKNLMEKYAQTPEMHIDYNAMDADPEMQRVRHLRTLLSDTHGSEWDSSPRYKPLSLMHSDRWTYNAPEAEAEQAGLDKLNKITSRRELSKGYSLKMDSDYNGKYAQQLFLKHESSPTPVGRVKWNSQTGNVHNLEVQPEHRQATAHLIAKAHELSHETGGTGPTSSNNLSSFSYKMMKRHAPDFIEDDTIVEGIHPHEYEESRHLHNQIHGEIQDHWNAVKPHLQAAASRLPDATGLHQDIAEHESRLSDMGSAIKTGRLVGASDAAFRATNTASRLVYSYNQHLPEEGKEHLFQHMKRLDDVSTNELGGR